MIFKLLLFRGKIAQHFLKLKLISTILISMAVVLLSTLLLYEIEPQSFDGRFHALWMVMTTVYTVGYGDISPQTDMGRLFTMFFIYPAGIGTFGVLVGKMTEKLITLSKLREEGKLNFTEKDHYILIGCPIKAEKTVEEILKLDKTAKFVFIDNQEKSSLNRYEVHYVNGDPTDEEILKKANILEAKSVTVFADEDIKNERLADSNSYTIASAIEIFGDEHNKNIPTIVEIFNEKHQKLFKNMRVEKLIITKQLISQTAALAAVRNEIK